MCGKRHVGKCVQVVKDLNIVVVLHVEGSVKRKALHSATWAEDFVEFRTRLRNKAADFLKAKPWLGAAHYAIV